MPLAGDPSWAVAADEGHLLVTAGADQVWLVEDVPASVVDLLARFWGPEPPTDEQLPRAARPVVQHLAALGALRPRVPAAAPESIGLVTVGSPLPAFAEQLGAFDGSAGADGITVVLRTNAPLRALEPVAEKLAAERAPHVLCDLAFHHTVTLGPHVVPGDTACLACLAGRVGTRWGDPLPPSEPGATFDGALAALLVSRWLRHRDEPSASLVNATVALDLDALATQREPLWRVPGCVVCGEWENNGRVPLPWTQGEV